MNFKYLKMRFDRFNKLVNLETKNYLRYAIGEVLLVVIGILVALQVNNWNEERKLKLSEKKVLLSFHEEVSKNLSTLKTSIEEKKTIIKINKEILEKTSPNSKWESSVKLDSLMYYLSVSGWIYVADEGVLNELINSGQLNNLEDFEIKNMIASLPQQINLITEEDRQYRDDLHQYFLPFLSKNYRLRNITGYRELYSYNKSNLGFSKHGLNDKKILNSLEFENILTIQAIWIKFSIEMCENLRLKYLRLQDLIIEKYPEVDFGNLSKDEEDSFWG